MTRLLGVLAALALASAARAEKPAGSIQVAPETVQWGPASPSMPAGTQIAVLEGDPKQKGLFTIRLRVPAGARLAPHWHPRDERVTVLSGRVGVGFGDRFDEQALRFLGAGSFYVNPARSRHFLAFPEDAVAQITGEGPWEVHFVSPAR